MTLPFGTMISVVTGEGGFMQTPQGVQDLPESRLADARKSMRRQTVMLLRASTEPGFQEAVAMGAGEVDGRAVENVQVSLAGDLVTVAIADDGQIVAMTYRGSGFGGGPGEVRQLFSDFREVGGLNLPHKTDSTFEGNPYISFTAATVEVDGEVDEAAFEKPAPEEPAASGGA